MRTSFLAFLFSALTVCTGLAEPASPPAPREEVPWSVAGSWDISHPTWKGPLTLLVNGAILGSKHEDIGRWALHVQDGHILVLLCGWEGPAQTVCFVGPDDLLGSVSEGQFRMHRHSGGRPNPLQSGFPLPSPLDFALAGTPWSVVGTWDCNHGEAWSAPLTFQEGGTFLKDGSEQEGGHWSLCTEKTEVLLVLRWNHWPAEMVTLFGADEFSGAPQHGDLQMHRRAGTWSGVPK